MLIDCHVNPAGLDPNEFSEKVTNAGLDAVVIAQTHSGTGLDPFIKAVEDNGQRAFAGVELQLERGTLVFVPKENDAGFAGADWAPPSAHWTLESVSQALEGREGVLLAAHPYFRDENRPLGDGVYRAKGLTAIATRVGRGLSSWDRLAEQAANKRHLGRMGSCGGEIDHLGGAATVLPDVVENQSNLVEVLEGKNYMPLEFDDPSAPKDRAAPAPAAPRSGGRDDRRGPRRDDRGRGGRSRDSRPRRGRRD